MISLYIFFFSTLSLILYAYFSYFSLTKFIFFYVYVNLFFTLPKHLKISVSLYTLTQSDIPHILNYIPTLPLIKITLHFSGLCSKMYSILIASDKQKHTAAGVKKCVRDKELRHALYRKNLVGSSDGQSIKSIPGGSLYSSNDI